MSAPPPHLVCFGNCQVHAIGHILRRFVAPHIPFTLDCIDAYKAAPAVAAQGLARATIVVAQRSAWAAPLDLSGVPATARVHVIPMVSGAFLWPKHGGSHPLRASPGRGDPPYTPNYNDRFLAQLITRDVSPADALEQYRHYDLARRAHVQRLYELSMESQQQIDAETGYGCTAIIEDHLASEPLFVSPYHFGIRLARHIAGELIRRIGWPSLYAERVETYLNAVPLVARDPPIHPTVAAHFRLGWVQPETLYPFLFEGGYTFDEYVLRFMQALWSPALQEGVLDARAGRPEARSKLEQGIIEAPRTAVGRQELSQVLERAGDHEGALLLQRQAVEHDPKPALLHRLGRLLRQRGDLESAAATLRRAAAADGSSAPIWASLRDTLKQLGAHAAAAEAQQRFAEFRAGG